MASLGSLIAAMSIVRAERIQGFMPPDYLKWFADQASVRKRIVEVGCYRGRTTTALCDNCSGQVTAVDTWEGSPGLMHQIGYMKAETKNADWLFEEFMHNMAEFDNLEICRMPSLEAASLFRKKQRKFDLVFIDGLHDYESVKADITAWLPLVEAGGVLCGHDYDYPDVKRAVMEFLPGIHGPSDANMWILSIGR